MTTLKTRKVARLLPRFRWLCTALALLPAVLASAQDAQTDKLKDNKFPLNLPATARFDVTRTALEQLFHSEGTVNIAMSPSFQLKGNIENKELDATGDGTMLIRTEGFDGAMLSLARFTDADQSVHFTGHLLKLHAPDGMLLMEKDHSFYFIRTQQRYLVAE